MSSNVNRSVHFEWMFLEIKRIRDEFMVRIGGQRKQYGALLQETINLKQFYFTVISWWTTAVETDESKMEFAPLPLEKQIKGVNPVAAPEIFCGEHRGGKMRFWGGKNPKMAYFGHFSSDGGQVGGRASDWGENAPHAPTPWCRHCVNQKWLNWLFAFFQVVDSHLHKIVSPTNIGCSLIHFYHPQHCWKTNNWQWQEFLKMFRMFWRLERFKISS